MSLSASFWSKSLIVGEERGKVGRASKGEGSGMAATLNMVVRVGPIEKAFNKAFMELKELAMWIWRERYSRGG